MMWHWCKCLWHQMTKKSCHISFQLSWCKECNGAGCDAIAIMLCQHQCQCCTSIWWYWYQASSVVPLIMLWASHDADAGANGITWSTKSCWISFWSSSYNKWNGTSDNTVDIMWHQHQYQCCYMTKIILPCISIILANQMQWCHWWCHWHHMMLMPMASHDLKVMLHLILLIFT